MAAIQYSSRLRFVDPDKLPEADVKLDHLPLYGWGHEKLGNLDGWLFRSLIQTEAAGRARRAAADDPGRPRRTRQVGI